MATKQFLTLDGLTRYDELLKGVMSAEDAKAIKSISVSGNTVSFFKTEDGSGTAYVTVNMPDISNLMSKISSATGGKIVTSTATGEVSESATAISDLATNAFVGSIPAGSSATTVIGYVDEAVGDATDDLMPKGSSWTGDRAVMSNSDGTISEGLSVGDGGERGIVTGYFASTSVGDIPIIGSLTGSDMLHGSGVSIDDVENAIGATTGFASDNTIASFIGSIPQGSSATDVIGYVDEAVAEAGDDAEITLVEAQTPTTGYLKTYELYQGGNAAANLVGKIDIPKDLVVTSGEIVVNPTGQPAGTYLKLTIANQTAPVYINVADLADVYTAQQSAAQVQLVISATNEISATIVAGSVTATELASNAVTTAKIADDAVTAAKVAIAAHTESQTAGADGIAISVTTTDGQVSSVSASIASNTYASAAQGALADTALQPEDVGEISTSDIESLFE